MKKIAVLFFLILLCGMTAFAALDDVSHGKPYTLSGEPSSSYPDDKKMLTDGVHGNATDGSYFKSGTYVGVSAQNLNTDGIFEITVDLEEVKKDITGFDLYYAVETDADVYAPEYCVFSYSEDGSNYTQGGKVMSGEATSAGICKAGVISCRLNDGVSARYVKFTVRNPNMTETNAGENIGWMFIDEVTVLQDDGKTPVMGDLLVYPLAAVFVICCGALGVVIGIKAFKRNKAEF